MQKLTLNLAALLLGAMLFSAHPAVAVSPSYPGLDVLPLGIVLPATTTLAEERCFNVTQAEAQGFGLLVVHLDLELATDGNLTMVVYARSAKPSKTYQLQHVETAAGVGTSYNASWVKAVTALGDEEFPWRADISGFAGARACFSHSGGTANDFIEVNAHMSTK